MHHEITIVAVVGCLHRNSLVRQNGPRLRVPFGFLKPMIETFPPSTPLDYLLRAAGKGFAVKIRVRNLSNSIHWKKVPNTLLLFGSIKSTRFYLEHYHYPPALGEHP